MPAFVSLGSDSRDEAPEDRVSIARGWLAENQISA
jgi:hypothetical protein